VVFCHQLRAGRLKNESHKKGSSRSSMFAQDKLPQIAKITNNVLSAHPVLIMLINILAKLSLSQLTLIQSFLKLPDKYVCHLK
jgi:hypothetical protein